MNIDGIQSGLVHTALITARSVEVPSPADQVFYTISINVEGGSVSFENVQSQPGSRWTDYMPTNPSDELPNVFPFPLGHRVPVHIERRGDEFKLFIDRGEVPEFGGCP
jgi:hypothetical protein